MNTKFDATINIVCPEKCTHAIVSLVYTEQYLGDYTRQWQLICSCFPFGLVISNLNILCKHFH